MGSVTTVEIIVECVNSILSLICQTIESTRGIKIPDSAAIFWSQIFLQKSINLLNFKFQLKF